MRVDAVKDDEIRQLRRALDAKNEELKDALNHKNACSFEVCLIPQSVKESLVFLFTLFMFRSLGCGMPS